MTPLRIEICLPLDELRKAAYNNIAKLNIALR